VNGEHCGHFARDEGDECQRQRRSVRVGEARLVARLGTVARLARHRADVDDDADKQAQSYNSTLFVRPAAPDIIVLAVPFFEPSTIGSRSVLHCHPELDVDWIHPWIELD